jgi:hypothetical protein
MSLLLEQQAPVELGDRLRDACCVTTEFLSDIIRATCRRFPSAVQNFRSTRIARLIESQAWTDAALALIDLELPQWQVRRLTHDDGEWYCALSRQRELPDWLDQSIETRHADLALAILSAFVEAQRTSSNSYGLAQTLNATSPAKEYKRETCRTSLVQCGVSHRAHRQESARPMGRPGQNGLYGGLFVNRTQAIKYALFENGHHPETIVELSGEIELDMRGGPIPIDWPAGRSI